jgi:hypothetical protein
VKSYINGCNTQVVNPIRKNQLSKEELLTLEPIKTSLAIKLTMLIIIFWNFLILIKNKFHFFFCIIHNHGFMYVI